MLVSQRSATRGRRYAMISTADAGPPPVSTKLVKGPWLINTRSEPLDELLTVCIAAARAGGDELISWRGRFQTREKGITDFVTDADLASQAAIHRVVHSRFPEHGFIGEEQPPNEFPGDSTHFHWIVDPLDGTTNYVHDFPFYAVSVAVARGRELLAGVVYDPLADKCFSASAGNGAWLDGVRLTTSHARLVHEALVAVSLPARVEPTSPDLADLVVASQRCQGVRRSGSAALNMAHVASGALDAFWAAHIHPWDVAAGVLLIQEAGGVISGRDGRDFDLWNPHFVAAAGAQLHSGLLQTLTPYLGAK